MEFLENYNWDKEIKIIEEKWKKLSLKEYLTKE